MIRKLDGRIALWIRLGKRNPATGAKGRFPRRSLRPQRLMFVRHLRRSDFEIITTKLVKRLNPGSLVYQDFHENRFESARTSPAQAAPLCLLPACCATAPCLLLAAPAAIFEPNEWESRIGDPAWRTPPDIPCTRSTRRSNHPAAGRHGLSWRRRKCRRFPALRGARSSSRSRAFRGCVPERDWSITQPVVDLECG